MASVENMPLTGGLLLGRKRMSWPTLSTAGSCVGDQFIADSRIKRAYQGRALGQAQRALAAQCCVPSPHLVRLLEIARSADNKAGSGNGLWNKTRQRLFKRIINPREGD